MSLLVLLREGAPVVPAPSVSVSGTKGLDRPHFAFPFQRGAKGKVGVVEQDTVEHVSACVNVIVRCPSGFRLERPEFGWPFPEFQAIPLDLGALREALTRLEPRATPDIGQYTDAAETAVQHVQITEGVAT